MMPDARRRLNALANEAVCAPSSKSNTQTARSANKDQDQTLARALMARSRHVTSLIPYGTAPGLASKPVCDRSHTFRRRHVSDRAPRTVSL